jgi:hypothetical protein
MAGAAAFFRLRGWQHLRTLRTGADSMNLDSRTTRSLAVLLLGLLTASPAAAQFGIRGGMDLTRFIGAGARGTDSRSQLGFGGTFGLFSFGPFTLMAEGYYRQKGAKNVQEFNDQVLQGGSAEIGLDYVEVPVLLRLNLPTLAHRFVPYLNAGPAFAWRIDCSIRFDAASGTAEQACADLQSANLEETLKDYEQGFVAGGGIDVAVLGGAGAINLDARMTEGLSRINESAAGGAEIRTRVFSLMLGYSFGIPGGLGVPGSGFRSRQR